MPRGGPYIDWEAIDQEVKPKGPVALHEYDKSKRVLKYFSNAGDIILAAIGLGGVIAVVWLLFYLVGMLWGTVYFWPVVILLGGFTLWVGLHSIYDHHRRIVTRGDKEGIIDE